MTTDNWIALLGVLGGICILGVAIITLSLRQMKELEYLQKKHYNQGYVDGYLDGKERCGDN